MYWILGHGGYDNGATAKNGESEKVLNMKIAQYLKKYLDDYDVDVYLTRTDNDSFVSVLDRGLFARRKKADICISLHFNSAPRNNQSGAEVWVTNNKSLDKYNKNCTELSKYILNNLSDLGIRNRGVKTKYSTGDITDIYSDGSISDYYGIIRYCMRGCKIDYGKIEPKGATPANVQKGEGVPAIIVEHCFVKGTDYSFINSEKKLKKIAEADGKAIVDYYKLIAKKDKIGEIKLSVDAKDYKTNAKFSWTKSNNAKQYNLKIRKGEPGNVVKYKNVMNLSEASYTRNLTAGYYEVFVEAVNDKEKVSSNKVCFIVGTPDEKPTEVVKNVKVEPVTNKSITLSWSKAENCDGYIIYMYNKEQNKWEKSTQVDKNTTTYINNNLVPGKQYKFRIKTYNSSKKMNYECDKYKEIEEKTRLDYIKNISAKATKNSITINWNKHKDANGYYVYMYNDSKGTWERYTKTKENSVNVTGLKSGKKYKFKIKAYKKTNKEGFFSSKLQSLYVSTN